MNNNLFFYEKNDILSKYDNTFKGNFYFENQLNQDSLEKYTKVKQKRYIVSTESFVDYIYISYIEEEKSNDGIYVKCGNTDLLFVPIGTNIYLLAHVNIINNDLNHILYTFMKKHNAVIDITKYQTYFKKYSSEIPIYKKNK